MIVAGIYSFNNGKEIIESQYSRELQDVKEIIASVDSATHKTKVSEEVTMVGELLYSPTALNTEFKQGFGQRDWCYRRINCNYSQAFYTGGYTSTLSSRGAFREIDYVKNKVGVEVQFGKYSFMVYNVCAKMTIFHNLGVIDVGIEIVPVKDFAAEMSSGVSYFEQFVWDLEKRGVADIDIPVLVLGIAA